MLNKEEIEDIKDDLRTFHKILWNEHREGTYTIQRTLEYINQLESDKQKLIEKLEEDIETNNKLMTDVLNYTNMVKATRVNYAQGILEILKKE